MYMKPMSPATHSNVPSGSPSLLSLNCLVLGDEPKSIFPIEIANNRNVANLRDGIKDKIGPAFDDVLATSLFLWNVSFPVDADLEQKLQTLVLLKALSSVVKLLKVFPQVCEGHLHVVIKCPPPSVVYSLAARIRPSSSNNSNYSDQRPAKRLRIHESDDIFSNLHKNFWKRGEHSFVKRSIEVPNPLSLEVENGSEPLSMTVIEHPEGPKQSFPFGLSKLLVIETYETFWDILQSENEKWQELVRNPGQPRFFSLSHTTIVTGQPGIGKTVFLTYVLLRRLMSGLTTIYCDSKTNAYIFDDMGVRRETISDELRISELDHNARCCALVNLGDKLASVPPVFYPETRVGRVVVATPPVEKHWSTFSHENTARVCCMPTWSWGPLYFASIIFSNKDLNTLDMDHCKRLREVYSFFRGIPRLCFRSLTPEGFEAQRVIIDKDINDIASMHDFIRATPNQLPFKASTSPRLVRVEPIDNNWHRTRTELMSDRVAELVFKRIHDATRAQLSETPVQYLADPNARGKAGVLFKHTAHAAHAAIRKGRTLNIIPLSSDPTVDEFIQIPPVGNDGSSRYYSLAILDKKASQNVHADFLNLYMTPISTTEESIASLFISPEHTTFLFQMTVGEKHDIKFRGLDKVVSSLPAKARKDIRFVFVIPDPAEFGVRFQGIGSIQTIDTSQGADTNKIEQFKGIPQYVCRLKLDGE